MSKTTTLFLKENLKLLQNTNNLTIHSLSKATGVSKSTLHGILNGSEPRGISALKKIAKYFKIKVDDLCFREIRGAKEISESHAINNDKIGIFIIKGIKKFSADNDLFQKIVCEFTKESNL